MILTVTQSCQRQGALQIRVTVQPVGVNFQPDFYFTFSVGDVELAPSTRVVSALRERELTGRRLPTVVHFYNTRHVSHPPLLQRANAALPAWNGVRVFDLALTDAWKVECIAGAPILVETCASPGGAFVTA